MDDVRQKRALLIVVMASSAFIPFMASAVNIALPSIGRDFHLDAVLMSWIATSYLLSSAVFILPFGRLADIYGRKLVFRLGLILFLMASLLVALSRSITVLLIARTGQGFGSAMMFATGVAMLTSAFSAGDRGKAIGLNVSAVYIGLSMGPVLGGLLTQWFGWRSLFMIMVPGCLAILFVLWKYLHQEWIESQGERFDVPGALLFAVATSCSLYGFSALPHTSAMIIMAIGAACAFTFILRQLNIGHPIVDIRMFQQNRAFAFSNLAAFINYGATTAVVFMLSLYLQYCKGLSPRAAGLLMMAQPLVQALTSPMAGRLSDRIEPQRLASAGMMLTVLGLLLLSILSTATPVYYIVFCLLILGLGFGLFSSPNTNAIMGSVQKRHYGIASAMVSAMRLLGQMFSMGLATLILHSRVGRRVITPDLYPLFMESMKTVLRAAAVLCFIGVFASMARGKLNREVER